MSDHLRCIQRLSLVRVSGTALTCAEHVAFLFGRRSRTVTLLTFMYLCVAPIVGDSCCVVQAAASYISWTE